MSLQKIYLEVIRKYFSHLSDLPICRVSRGSLKENRRAIVFGTYNARKNEVRIHPILLQEGVAPEALEFVIYHELLHFEDRAYLLKRRKGQGVHTKSFHAREKEFPLFKEAKAALNKLFKENAKQETLKKSSLRGEALNEALNASLSRLDEVLERYGFATAAMKKQKKGV